MPNLSIFARQIRQKDGLYSLNDLHHASGYDRKNQPSLFLANAKTRALIKEIEQLQGIPRSEVVTTSKAYGTYGCKQLVVAYAAWISPKIHVATLNAFLAHTGPQRLSIPVLSNRMLVLIESGQVKVIDASSKNLLDAQALQTIQGNLHTVSRQLNWAMGIAGADAVCIPMQEV